MERSDGTSLKETKISFLMGGIPKREKLERIFLLSDVCSHKISLKKKNVEEPRVP